VDIASIEVRREEKRTEQKRKKSLQTGSGAHPASCPMGFERLCPRK
jgi:hypothetical protein